MELPGDSVSLRELAAEFVFLAVQRGCIGPDMFRSLAAERPACADRIDAIARLWREPATEPAELSKFGPRPIYPDDHARLLSQQLERAYARKDALQEVDADTAEVDADILQLKRTLRSGGRLKAGDWLGHGRYLLLKQLGKGGFGTVWEGLDRNTNNHIAIKVLHPEIAGDRIRRGRFFRGARIMSELDHGGVVRVLDCYGEDDDYYYFVMELIPGGSLQQAVHDGNSVDVVAVLLGVGDALAEAHARGVIHRDVKPTNILLTATGEPRLTDFDLVAAKDTTGGTRTGALGTMVYAAPELLARSQDADARADVYGLGMTAVFLLHGAELPLSIVRDASGFINRLPCSTRLQRILQQATSWEPVDRFADAGALCRNLRQMAKDRC